MGRSLNTAKNDYDTMVSTRRKQLEKPLNKIDEITSLTESSNVERLDGGQQNFRVLSLKILIQSSFVFHRQIAS